MRRLQLKKLDDWWEKPRSAYVVDENREVTPLELFFDIGFTIYFSRVSADFSANITMSTLFEFILLFTLGWWAWFNFMVYHDIHGKDDTRHRVFTFGKLFCVIGMAIYARGALTENYNIFVSFVIVLYLIVTYLWWFTKVADKDHHEALTMSRIYFISIVVLFISLFVPQQYKLPLFLAGFGLSISVLLLLRVFHKNAIFFRTDIITISLIKRFSRLVLIIMCHILSTIVYVVKDSNMKWPEPFEFMAIALLTTFAIWCLYFDFINARRIKHKVSAFYICIVGNYFLMLSMSMTNATFRNILGTNANSAVNFLALSLVVILLSLTLLNICHEKKGANLKFKNWAMAVSGVSIILSSVFIDSILIKLIVNIFALFFPIVVDVIDLCCVEEDCKCSKCGKCKNTDNA